ncbi:hypothetical protein BGX24_009299 [Mortierella sp. AD032]|nr:hypothetical protein BGX24_009299 [Mortierella sp. AD032]
MHTATFADSSSNGTVLQWPLYLSFTLSRHTYLGALGQHEQEQGQRQQQHIIHLDHGFQIALLAYNDIYDDSNMPLLSSNNNSNKTHNEDDDLPKLSYDTFVVDSDTSTATTITTTNTTTTATASMAAHTLLSDTKTSRQSAKTTIDDITFDLCNNTPTVNSGNEMINCNDDHSNAIVFEMTLTLGRNVEHANKYPTMTRVIHLFEIGYKTDRLCLSKAVEGCDLIHQGVSILIETDMFGNQDFCTFGILLSSDPLDLLVPPKVIDQSASGNFGRAMLIRFLFDFSTADVVYAAGPTAASRSHNSALPIAQRQGRDPRLLTHAHSAIVRQWPAFDNLLRHFPHPQEDPKIHKLVDVDPYAMRLVINFLYTGQIEGPGYIGLVDWRPIFQLAHRFRIPRLIDLSLTELCKDISIRTVLPTLFKWAYQHSDYEDRLLEVLVEHVNDAFQHTLKESLEPFSEHPEFSRIQRKLKAMKAAK